MKNLFKIGELSKKADISIDAIRFYETKKLISPHSRSNSGYRYYDVSAIERLNFIHKGKELGFSLEEIKDLLEIKVNRNGKCSLALEKLELKITTIDEKIKSLNKIKVILNNMALNCRESKVDNPCYFFHALLNDGGKNEK